MLNTYIKNRGITQTLIHNNSHNHVNQIAWDADYDGDVANITLDTDTDGKHKHYDIKLDNEDLANILNIQGVNIPIHKRLQMDFKEPAIIPEEYYIELPNYDFQPRQPKISEPETSSLEELLTRHVSSPKTGEELIVPLTIDRKTKYTLTPRRRHRRQKTHVTHRVYKKPKTIKKSSSRTSKSKSKTSRSKSTSMLELL
jgi:hypothetical protein